MPYRILLLLSLLLLCDSFQATGQEDLAGVIYSQAGEPVAFANIYNLQSKQGTSSDLGGRFRLSAKAGDSLRITFIGYESQYRVLSVADFLKPVRIILKDNSYLLRDGRGGRGGRLGWAVGQLRGDTEVY